MATGERNTTIMDENLLKIWSPFSKNVRNGLKLYLGSNNDLYTFSLDYGWNGK